MYRIMVECLDPRQERLVDRLDVMRAKALALVDTGASICICSKDTAKALMKVGHTLKKGPALRANTANGKKIIVTSYVETVVIIRMLGLEPIVKKERFWIVDELSEHIILSCEFVTETGIVSLNGHIPVAEDEFGDEEDETYVLTGKCQEKASDALEADDDEEAWRKIIIAPGFSLTEETKRLLQHHRKVYRSKMPSQPADVPKAHIDMKEGEHLKPLPFRWLSAEEEKIALDLVDDLIATNAVFETRVMSASPIVLARKKNGKFRLCVNYKLRNKQTKPIETVMPHPQVTVHAFVGCRFFFCTDIVAAYHRIPLTNATKELLAFRVNHRTFAYNVLPFGAQQSPQLFLQTIYFILEDLMQSEDCVIRSFMDDIAGGAKTEQELLIGLDRLLTRLGRYGFTLSPEKTRIGFDEIPFCGNIIGRRGSRIDPERVRALLSLRKPTNVEETMSVLGTLNFCRERFHNFAEIMAPITRLLSKSVKFVWGKEQDAAWERMRDVVRTCPVLAFMDPTATTVVTTDASQIAVAAVLSQIGKDGVERPVYFASRVLSPRESRWSNDTRELFAWLFAVTRFRNYIAQTSIVIRTDCESLLEAKPEDNNAKKLRWIGKIREFPHSVEFIEGKKNVIADCLSRMTVADEAVAMMIDTEDEYVDEEEREELLELYAVTTRGKRTASSSNNNNNIRPTPAKRARKRVEVVNDQEESEDESSDDERKSEDSDYDQRFSDVEMDDDGGNNNNTDEGQYGRTLVVFNNEDERPEESFIRRVLKQYHGVRGHFGKKSTMWMLRRDGWRWRGQTKDVDLFVQHCHLCVKQREVAPKEKKKGEVHNIASYGPHEEYAVDLCGPFEKKGTDDNQYFMIVVDMFSRWMFLKVLKEPKARYVVRALEEVLATCRIPTRLRFDKGSVFTSHLFQQYLKSKNITPVVVATNLHSANGTAEVYLRHVQKQLRVLSMHFGGRHRWYQHLPKIAMMFNNKPSFSTGITPMEMMFPGSIDDFDKFKAQIANMTVEGQGRHQAREERNNALLFIEERRKKEREYIERARVTQKKVLESRKKREVENPDSFLVGEWVFFRPDKYRSKLEARRFGPYQIVERRGDLYVLEETLDATKRFVKHISSLSTCDISYVKNANFFNSNDTCTFIVEKVIGHSPKVQDKRDLKPSQIKVKWKYYGDSWNSWIWLSNVSKELIPLKEYLSTNRLRVQGGSVTRV